MKKSVVECRSFAQEIVSYYPKVLSAVDVISEANSIAKGWLEITEIARTRKGHSIQLISQASSKTHNALLSGYSMPRGAIKNKPKTEFSCLFRGNHNLVRVSIFLERSPRPKPVATTGNTQDAIGIGSPIKPT